MSQYTGSQSMIDQARWLLNDRGASDYLASYDRMKNLVHQQAHAIIARVGMPLIKTTLAVTPGTQDYILDSGKTNLTLVSVINGNNLPLERCSWQSMDGLNWWGNKALGWPRVYATYEDTSNQTVVRLWPSPVQADTMTVMYTEAVAAMTTASDGFTLPVSDSLALLVAKSAALEILLATDAEILRKRGFSKDISSRWYRDIEQGVKDERIRIARMKRSPNIELARR